MLPPDISEENILRVPVFSLILHETSWQYSVQFLSAWCRHIPKPMNLQREFETYFKRYYTPIGMYVLRICGDASEAEDIVQETFSVAWEKWSEGERPEYFRAYLYRTAHNITIDRLRKKSTVRADIPIQDIDDAEIVDEVIDTSERDARLWIAISKLPDRCRQVFLMSKRDGLSHAEIAEELGISVKTVENQITKAFKSLRGTLKDTNGKVFFLPFL